MLRTPLILVWSAMLVFAGAGCRQGANAPSATGDRMAKKTIEQVQKEHTDEWMAIPGVVGTAIGRHDGKPCILVLTAANTEQVRAKIPSQAEGHPVVVQYSGEVRALKDRAAPSP